MKRAAGWTPDRITELHGLLAKYWRSVGDADVFEAYFSRLQQFKPHVVRAAAASLFSTQERVQKPSPDALARRCLEIDPPPVVTTEDDGQPKMSMREFRERHATPEQRAKLAAMRGRKTVQDGRTTR